VSEPLSPLDATFLELEQADESAHMHIGGLLVFEPRPNGKPPRIGAVRRQLEFRLAALPRYRMRLSGPRTGGLSQLSWETDPDFDIAEHVTRAALPAPGGESELLTWAGDFWSLRLDRQRPLWEVVVLEGLADGRWAMCTKTHHALVDGVGSVDAAHLLLDTARRPRQRVAAPTSPEPEGAHHGFVERAAATLAGGVKAGADAALHPQRLLKALGQAESMVELIIRDEVQAAPPSSINVPIGLRRRFAAAEFDLDELKRIKRALGGTVNDVVLAAVSGGLRRLLVERGDEPPAGGLRAMVPVNIRDAGEQLGNRISSLFVHLPVAEPDPERRYRLAAARAEDLKHGSQSQGSSALIKLAGLAPPVLHSVLAQALFASRLFNVTVTNVPGPQQPLYAFGSRMESILPLVPLAAEHALGVAVLSYDGRVFFGLNADRRSVPDLENLRDGIVEAMDELRALARDPVGAGGGG
jgi:WS/DGAT/MGAT family acyltransferase